MSDGRAGPELREEWVLYISVNCARLPMLLIELTAAIDDAVRGMPRVCKPLVPQRQSLPLRTVDDRLSHIRPNSASSTKRSGAYTSMSVGMTL